MFKTMMTMLTKTMVEIVVDKEHFNDVKEFCERMAEYELDSTNYLEDHGVCYKMYVQFPIMETHTIKRLVKRLDGVIAVN